MGILFVDDDSSQIAYFKYKFERSGIKKVYTAKSAKEALKLVEECSDIDLVVSDICMPGVSGIDLCRDIKRQNDSLKVILLSGSMSLSPFDALEIGADYFFTKSRENEKQLIETILDEVGRSLLSIGKEKIKGALKAPNLKPVLGS